VIIIDSAKSGLTTGFRTMDSLTGGKAVNLGRVNVTAIQSALSDCRIGVEGAEEDPEDIKGGNWYSTWFYELFQEPAYKEYSGWGNMKPK
jgi:hypothetical protein